MSPAHKKRFIVISILLGGTALGIALVLFALSKNINLFYSPTQLMVEKIASGKTVRIGGMVVKNSVLRKNDLAMEFVITDFSQEVKVHYTGILPDLFREGQGIVALGKINSQGEFIAHEVLAKHDEKYMPPEVAKSLVMQAK